MAENQGGNPIVHSFGPEGEKKTAMQIAAEEAIRAKKVAADPNYKGDNPKTDDQIRKDMIKMGIIQPKAKSEEAQLTPEQKNLERSRRGVQVQAKQVGRAEEKEGQWHFGEEVQNKAHAAMMEDLQKDGKLKEGGKIFEWPSREPKQKSGVSGVEGEIVRKAKGTEPDRRPGIERKIDSLGVQLSNLVIAIEMARFRKEEGNIKSLIDGSEAIKKQMVDLGAIKDTIDGYILEASGALPNLKSFYTLTEVATQDQIEKENKRSDQVVLGRAKKSSEALYEFLRGLYPTPEKDSRHGKNDEYVRKIAEREVAKRVRERIKGEKKVGRDSALGVKLSTEEYQNTRKGLFEAQKENLQNSTPESVAKIQSLMKKIQDHFRAAGKSEANAKSEAEMIAMIDEKRARSALIDEGFIPKPEPKPEPKAGAKTGLKRGKIKEGAGEVEKGGEGGEDEEDAKEIEENEKMRAGEAPAVRDLIDTAARYSKLTRQGDPHGQRDEEVTRARNRPILKLRNKLVELGMDGSLITKLEAIPSKGKRTRIKALLGPFLKEFGKRNAGAADFIQPPRPAEVVKVKTETDFVAQMKREFAGEIKGEIALLHGSEMQQLQEVAGQMIDFLTEKWRERLTKPIYDMYPDEVKMGMLRAHVSANLKELRGEILERFIGRIAEQKEN